MRYILRPNILIAALLTVSVFFELKAQGNQTINSDLTRVVNTAVPFLRIVPDARGGAMGDVGIATPVDPNATFYNASKLAFAKKRLGLSLSYAPWLRALGITDIFM
ncbi:MAG TPA: hypothetical protein PKA75_10480, partial [Chitinophagales bacterium]|nr:hypothetical protein [Chitinophagales bacterium]